MATFPYLALGSKSNSTYGMLSERSEALFAEIKKHLTDAWPNASPGDKRRLKSIGGCLDKLSAFLMQAQRMRKYHRALLDLATNFNQYGEARLPMPMAHAIGGREQCADFEASLLQARACLDRLTWFISDQLGQQSSSFASLENILKNSKNPKAAQLLKLLGKCKHLEISLVGSGNPDPLRDFIAHKGAASEITSNCFALYYFGENLVLVCDSELGDETERIPVLRTSHNLSHDLPFFVLNSLAAWCELGTVSYKHFSPNWQIVSIALSDFVEKEKTVLDLNVIKRMTPSGFQCAMLHVNPTVLSHRIKVDPGPQSFSFNLGEPQ